MPATHTWLGSIVAVAVCSAMVLARPIVDAQGSREVVISEIMWAKTEYIELYNTTDAVIDLNGWNITRQKIGATEEDHIVEFGNSDTIPAHAYFIIEASEGASTIPANKIKSSLGLVDEGALLRLHSSDGVVVDIANRLGGWFAGQNTSVGIAMERISVQGDGEDSGSWASSTGSVGGRTGTPGQQNSQEATLAPSSSPTPAPTVVPTDIPTPTPTPILTPDPTVTTLPTATPGASLTVSPTPVEPREYSSDIRINEFLPDPSGDDTTLEFIELYNATGDLVDLTDWVLDDIEGGGSAPYNIPAETIIGGGSFIVLYRTQTHISMNNDSDHVRLIRPDGVVQNDISYANAKEGYSLNFGGGNDFQRSSTPTQGGHNIITVPTNTPKPTATSAPENEEKSHDFSTKLVVNELLPNPVGDDTKNEFIEIYNADNRLISLRGWMLDDEVGGSTPYQFLDDDNIAAGTYLLVPRSVSSLALNNDHDKARIIDPDGRIISESSYSKAFEGQSLNLTDDAEYVWSTILTPSIKNKIHVQGTVSPKKAKEPAPKKKAITKHSAQKRYSVSTDTGAVLGVMTSPSLLPWPEITHGSDNIEPSQASVPSRSSAKQKVFVLFGITMAMGQLYSGISHKERIWHR